jgi:hypothetical protein
VDLIIVDIPKGLPIPIVSTPANVVPAWNQSVESFLEHMFVFAYDFFHDDGAIIVIQC